MKKSLFGACVLTFTCLYGLLAAIIILIFLLTGGNVLYGVGISIIILLLQYLLSPFFTDISMKWFYKAKFNAEVPEYLKLFIESTCKKYNMKYPKIGLILDGAPNAFTYGRTKNDARIVLTQGIFDLLNEEEVKSVVAHELGHASHYDILFMTMAQLVPLILYAIYEIFTSNSKDDSDSNKLAIVGYIAYVLYVISQYIVLYLSRQREYYADSFAIEETKNPNALAEALVKIGFGLSTNSTKGSRVSKSNALGIFDSKSSKSLAVSAFDNDNKVSKEKIKSAMRWEKWNLWAIYYEINSTHPLISKRLIAISNRSKEFNQEPYIIFDEKKPESFVDDFLFELLLLFAPIICLIISIVVMTITKNLTYLAVGLLLTIILSYIKFKRAHKNNNYKETNVSDLLGEVKVSNITTIPCTLKGKIIGRGNPGCIFNEDFIIKDETGIIFLDYNQPLNLLNKIFALFKSSSYFDKEITVRGWYKRSPVPYVEIYSMDVDSKTKKIYTYGLSNGIYISLILILASLTVFTFL